MTAARTRDRQRRKVYDAELLVHAMIDRAGPGGLVSIAGTTLVVPVEAKFGCIESVQRYLDQVLTRPSLIARFGPVPPVRVRERRGQSAAHYETGDTIAIPNNHHGCREMTVLHEITHHLIAHSTAADVAAHGPEFAATLVWLVDDVIGPEAAFLLRTLMWQNDVRLS